jgi:spermidine/putrescine transport system permease protein
VTERRIRLVFWLTVIFLYAPVFVLVIYSFNDTRFSARWAGVTLKWYVQLLESRDTLDALRNTLFVSLTSTAIATVLGTLLAIGLYRPAARSNLLVDLVLYLPIIIPDIVIGVATLALYNVVNFPLGRVSIILAHVAFQISFVTLVVRARLQGFQPALLEAARDLGASQWQVLWHVLLPLLRPGIAAGALLALALSIDDFVITLFTAGSGSSTLPLRIYSMVKRGVTPDVNALSTLLLFATLIVLAGSQYVLRADGRTGNRR